MYRIVLIIFICVLMLGGCKKHQNTTTVQTTDTPRFELFEPEDMPSPASYQEAVNLAGRFETPLLLIFYADWCGPCRKMHSEVWDNEEVKEVLRRFVVYKINTDDERETMQKHGYVRYLPSYGIYDVVDGNLYKVKFASGGKSSSEIIGWLK